MTVLKVKRIHEKAILPVRNNANDSGLDLFAVEPTTIGPGERAMIGTGIAIELPENTEAQVRPRSGLAAKHGITVLNTPGTVDEGYRGEIIAIIINHGPEPFVVEEGMKIAQLVVAPVIYAEVIETEELSDSTRGEKGFGSSGS